MLKKTFLLLVPFFLISMLMKGQTEFTAVYNLSGDGNDVVAFEYNGQIYDGIILGNLIKSGITSSSSNNNFRGSNWPLGATNGSDEFTGDIDTSKYIAFYIEAANGYKFTITSITFGIGRSATGPRQWAWQGSADDYGQALNNYTNIHENLNLSEGIITNPDVNNNWTGNILSPGDEYKDITSFARFKLLGFNAEAIGGTAGLQGNITITGTFESTVNHIINLAPNILSGFEYIYDDGPSEMQSFTVSGENLVDNILINLPINYELSFTEEPFTPETSAIVLTEDEGEVDEHVFFIRLKAGLDEGVYNEAIQIISDQAQTKTLSLNGQVILFNVPVITVLPDELIDFTYIHGSGPSAVENFTVSAIHLTDDITISLPTDFELSFSNDPFAAETTEITLINDGGILVETEVFVRLKAGLENGDYSEIITISSDNHDNINVLLEGLVYSNNPVLTIISPVNNAFLYENDVEIVFETSNFIIGTDGKISYTLNGGDANDHITSDPIQLNDLDFGLNSVNLSLLDLNGDALEPPVNASVQFTIVEPMPGGMETFDNFAATGTTYTSGTFLGQDGSTWTYTEARGDYEITGKALMIGRNRTPQSNLVSGVISGGVGKISFDYMQAFATNVNLNILINDIVVGNVKSVSEQDIIKPSGEIIVNQPGDFVIKFINVNNSDGQVVIDNISWTGFMSDEPMISITSPSNGAVLYENDVEINFNVYNFQPQTDGFIKYTVNSEDSQYHSTLSPIMLNDLELGEYTVELELVDMDNNSLDPVVKTSVTFTIGEIQITSIYDIQFTEEENGDSPLINQQVLTQGIVTAVLGTKFWIQDGVGAWNGLYVFNTNLTAPQIGDLVIVGGTILEHFNLTEIAQLTYLEVVSSNNDLPDAVELTTGDVQLEMYESVLVKITGLCTDANAGYGMWVVNDGSGDILIDDDIYDYTPVLNHSYTVTGIAYYSYSERKILPRFEADVIDNGMSSDPFISITSPQNNSTIYSNSVSVAYSVLNFALGTDGKIKWVLNSGAPSFTVSSPINITNLIEGVNTITLSLVDMDEMPLNPVVQVTLIVNVDLSGPEYTDIYDIQYTEDVNGNSPLANQTVWVKGIVSASFNGTTYGKGYYLQQGAGEWNGIYVYDLVNTPEIGDSVSLRGLVKENFGMTQLENITGYSVFDIGGTLAEPVLVTTQEANAEKYESVLIKVLDAECVVAQNQFGEWTVNDGSGNLICKDNGAFAFNAVLGTIYNITGVLFYGYGNFSLQYRIPTDVQISADINNIETVNISVYPNPASDYVTIEIEGGADLINIIDLNGRILVALTNTKDLETINIQKLPSGLYFIIAEKDSKIHRTKISIQ